MGFVNVLHSYLFVALWIFIVRASTGARAPSLFLPQYWNMVRIDHHYAYIQARTVHKLLPFIHIADTKHIHLVRFCLSVPESGSVVVGTGDKCWACWRVDDTAYYVIMA